MIRSCLGISFIIVSSYWQLNSTGHQPRSNSTDSTEYLTQAIQFIKSVKQVELNEKSFVLADQPADIHGFDCLSDLLADTTTLSDNERIFVISSSNKSYIKQWRKDFFDDVTIIPSDTIKLIFGKDPFDDWNYFYEHYGSSFNSFSAPIFFRDYTFCLFYSDNSCGMLCGTGNLSLFQRKNNEWKLVKTYCEWIS